MLKGLQVLHTGKSMKIFKSSKNGLRFQFGRSGTGLMPIVLIYIKQKSQHWAVFILVSPL